MWRKLRKLLILRNFGIYDKINPFFLVMAIRTLIIWAERSKFDSTPEPRKNVLTWQVVNGKSMAFSAYCGIGICSGLARPAIRESENSINCGVEWRNLAAADQQNINCYEKSISSQSIKCWLFNASTHIMLKMYYAPPPPNNATHAHTLLARECTVHTLQIGIWNEFLRFGNISSNSYCSFISFTTWK